MDLRRWIEKTTSMFLFLSRERIAHREAITGIGLDMLEREVTGRVGEMDLLVGKSADSSSHAR